VSRVYIAKAVWDDATPEERADLATAGARVSLGQPATFDATGEPCEVDACVWYGFDDPGLDEPAFPLPFRGDANRALPTKPTKASERKMADARADVVARRAPQVDQTKGRP
jgi:hypothetical protein